MNPYKLVTVKCKRYCHRCGDELEHMNNKVWSCNNPNCIVYDVRFDHDGHPVRARLVAEPMLR
jgi:hypothetical protein